MKQVTINVNRQQHIVTVDPDTPLLFVFNDEMGVARSTVRLRNATMWSLHGDTSRPSRAVLRHAG